jgi:hypothetical protein
MAFNNKNDNTFCTLSFSSRKTAIAIKCYSGLKARMPLNVIIAVARKVFRFPFVSAMSPEVGDS